MDPNWPGKDVLAEISRMAERCGELAQRASDEGYGDLVSYAADASEVLKALADSVDLLNKEEA
jgi:hypothetical protein